VLGFIFGLFVSPACLIVMLHVTISQLRIMELGLLIIISCAKAKGELFSDICNSHFKTDIVLRAESVLCREMRHARALPLEG
jgi:hypothetical protein